MIAIACQVRLQGQDSVCGRSMCRARVNYVARYVNSGQPPTRMRTDSRLSRMLHVLLHMARHDQPFTSEQIAKMLDTNPVVVRRTMAGLRDAGYVRSEKGHGGGWLLARDLREVTLLDIHQAVGGPRLFAIGHMSDNPKCAVERVVNESLNQALGQAEALLLERFDAITLVLQLGHPLRCVMCCERMGYRWPDKEGLAAPQAVKR